MAGLNKGPLYLYSGLRMKNIAFNEEVNLMTVEEEKRRAKAEKEHLAMLIAMRSSEYKLDDLRRMKLKKLEEIAEKLGL